MSFAEELEALRVAMIERAEDQIAQVRALDRLGLQCDAAVMRELQAVLAGMQRRGGDITAVLQEIAARVQPPALPSPPPVAQINGQRGHHS